MDKKRTIADWLKELSETTESKEEDGLMMQTYLRRSGFPAAVVTCGIVYLEGHGTMEAPPTSIHSVAKMLLKVFAEQKAKVANEGR